MKPTVLLCSGATRNDHRIRTVKMTLRVGVIVNAAGPGRWVQSVRLRCCFQLLGCRDCATSQRKKCLKRTARFQSFFEGPANVVNQQGKARTTKNMTTQQAGI